MLSIRVSGHWRRWRRARGENAGDFGPTRCASSSALPPRSLPSSSRRRKASPARGLTERAKAIREFGGKLWALRLPRRDAETEDEVLMRTEGLAMRAGPRPHLEAGYLPLLREVLTSIGVVELEHRPLTTWNTSRQRVQPSGVFYGNRAFLVGPTDCAHDSRLWRLDRVDEAQILDQTFEHDPDFDLRCYAKQSLGTLPEDPVHVVLRFDNDPAYDARNFWFHPNQTRGWNEDTTLTVRFRADGIDEMCWHLVTWGRDWHAREALPASSTSYRDVRNAYPPSRTPRVTQKPEFTGHNQCTLSPCCHGPLRHLPNGCDIAHLDSTERANFPL